MLSVTDLQVSYGSIRALHGVSFEVAEGEIVTLIGANGAGKSTTLRAVTGLVPAAAGEIRYQGKVITRVPAHRIVQMGIGHVPEGRRVFADMTVRENLAIGGYTASPADARRNMEWALTTFPRLRERLNQPAGTLSGGEQQMLAMGRAIMASPKLLVLDEPSMGLSPLMVQEVFRIIREINSRGTTVLLVEQNAFMALSIAHRAYVLETGRVLLSGPAAEVAANPQVKSAYLGESLAGA
ncbi:MAG: ABC transporter ATP-binding protein [Mycobacterium leprae]